MDAYKKLSVLGEGTYGVVSKAKVKSSGAIVAIKRIRLGKVMDGVNFTALREIKLLKEIHHPNITALVDVFALKDNSINLVFEFMETDLEIVIKSKEITLMREHIKSYMKMMLEGIEHCHKCWILHRDLKPSNLLLAPDGRLKLGDFGLARTFASPDRRYTHQVVTRWYRAPELLFGARTYGGGVDMWAVGAIFAELMLRAPFLPGNSDIDQLDKIFQFLGTPTEKEWPEMKLLPDFCDFSSREPPRLSDIFSGASEDALDLLSQLLKFNPNDRISSTQALSHRYFSTFPAATPHEKLPMPPSRGEGSGFLSEYSDESGDDFESEEFVSPAKRKREGDIETPSKRMKETTIS